MAAEGMQASDLARLRAIAEEGRSRPLLAGPALVLWGTAIATAALFGWAVLTRVLAIPYWSVSLGWFALMGGAVLVGARMQRAQAASDAASSTANQVSRSVWTMAGAFLATLAIGLTIYAAVQARASGQAAWAMLSVMAPVTFGVYGIALAATAVAGGVAWLMRYAWSSLGLTIVTAALLGQSVQHLVMAAGVVLVSVVPGLRLARSTRGTRFG